MGRGAKKNLCRVPPIPLPPALNTFTGERRRYFARPVRNRKWPGFVYTIRRGMRFGRLLSNAGGRGGGAERPLCYRRGKRPEHAVKATQQRRARAIRLFARPTMAPCTRRSAAPPARLRLPKTGPNSAGEHRCPP